MNTTTKIYGCSDDLIEIESDKTKELDASCARISFTDGTCIRVTYEPNGVWKIKITRKGTVNHKLTECSGDPDASVYSDTFEINADVKAYKILR